MTAVDPAGTPGACVHRPPSPGQSMCQCEHQRIELGLAVAAIERATAERIAQAIEDAAVGRNATTRLHHACAARIAREAVR